MATRRSPQFDANVDTRLLKAIEANQLKGYDTEMISGYRAKTPKNPRSRHGRGAAIDVSLIDQATGKALDNYQDAATFAVYQQYANQVYQWALVNDPELAKQLAWGGYFSGGPGKYGALDTMHFDTGGMMAGGTWEGGLTEAQAKLWGLKPGGGISGANSARVTGPVDAAGGGDVDPVGPVRHPPNPTVGKGDLDTQQEPDDDPYSKLLEGLNDKKPKHWLEAFGEGLEGVKIGGRAVPAMPQRPGASRLDAAAVAPVSPLGGPEAAMRRDQLAAIMARLNSGSLF